MEILNISSEPIHAIPYLNVGTGRLVELKSLLLYRGVVDVLPTGLAGLVIASDLQGRDSREDEQGQRRLLGQVLAEDLQLLCELGELPPADRIGILLAGDLYARPQLDRRGGSGDVREVWKSFIDAGFRWAAGVAGNHCVIGDKPSAPAFEAFLCEPGIYFLDGDVADLDGLKIAGLSGIIGNPRRLFRRSEEDFVQEVCRLARERPDILILHDGPAFSDKCLQGCELLTEKLETLPSTLLIRGHTAWDPWFVTLNNGTQIVNVDAKVLVLTT